jgi:hypothetical protein
MTVTRFLMALLPAPGFKVNTPLDSVTRPFRD